VIRWRITELERVRFVMKDGKWSVTISPNRKSSAVKLA